MHPSYLYSVIYVCTDVCSFLSSAGPVHSSRHCSVHCSGYVTGQCNSIFHQSSKPARILCRSPSEPELVRAWNSGKPSPAIPWAIWVWHFRSCRYSVSAALWLWNCHESCWQGCQSRSTTRIVGFTKHIQYITPCRLCR